MKIVICDDDRKRAEQWERLIRQVGKPTAKYDIGLIESDQFTDVIQLLRRRQLEARRSREVDEKCIFDEADILVVDFDLLRFDASGTDTGESVAYLARTYSDCGFIIELNQFGTNWFDLTLSGRLESFADLNLGSDQLSNPGLWSPEFQGFRPWSWPIVPDAAMRLKRCAVEANKHRSDKVLDYLGLTEELAGVLPRSVREFLAPGKSPEETTFEEFATKSRYALRPADKPRNETQLGRIAAARISKWLENVLLAGQEVLVDAPHLVSRLPSLLNRPPTADSLNATARIARSASGTGLRQAAIAPARFEKQDWLSRPAWRWFEITRNEEIAENKSPWTAADVPFGFCEDISRFLPTPACREFVAEVDSVFRRRFITNLRVADGRRIASKYRSRPGRVNPRDPAKVKYEPADRLAV